MKKYLLASGIVVLVAGLSSCASNNTVAVVDTPDYTRYNAGYNVGYNQGDTLGGYGGYTGYGGWSSSYYTPGYSWPSTGLVGSYYPSSWSGYGNYGSYYGGAYVHRGYGAGYVGRGAYTGGRSGYVGGRGGHR